MKIVLRLELGSKTTADRTFEVPDDVAVEAVLKRFTACSLLPYNLSAMEVIGPPLEAGSLAGDRTYLVCTVNHERTISQIMHAPDILDLAGS